MFGQCTNIREEPEQKREGNKNREKKKKKLRNNSLEIIFVINIKLHIQ